MSCKKSVGGWPLEASSVGRDGRHKHRDPGVQKSLYNHWGRGGGGRWWPQPEAMWLLERN